MKRRTRNAAPMVAAICAGVLVGLLFLSYLVSSGLLHRRDTGINLNSQGDNTPVVDEDSQLLTAQSVDEVQIGPENAQQVIASVTRPQAYRCTIENTLYYSGGSSVMRCRRYADGSAVRTDTLNASGMVQSTVLRVKDTVYAWENGETTAYQGDWGSFSDDAAALLPTYEDVLRDGVELQSASRQDVEQEPCIRVSFMQGGYRCVYDVSAVSGLLRSAAFYSGDTLTRKVTVENLKLERPDSRMFTLPSGKSVWGE